MQASSAIPIDPTRCTTVVPMRVRFCETDLMGIVHHSNYFTYFEAGRVEWLRKRGVRYADWAVRGWHLAVVEVSARYLRPARFDDLLEVETTLTEVRAVSMRFAYRIVRGGVLLALGGTRLGCIGDDHKPLRIPEEMRDVVLAGERI